MTDILDNVDSDSSENEDISRLFPRYKPKIPNDFNLNKVSEEESPSHFLNLEKNGNESNVECEANGVSDGSPVNDTAQTNSDCQKQDHAPYEEDCSVVSAYGMFGINCAKHEDLKDENELKNSTDSDLVNKYENALTFQEFKLRESRIEIAGGREVFSSSRIRFPRKRFSDEILYNSNLSGLESKCNDEKRPPVRSKCREGNCGENESSTKSATQRMTAVCQLIQRAEWEKSSQECPESKETMVYETDIDGSEVIYDDIGDWVERSPSVAENLSHLKLESECSSSLHESINSFCKPLTVSTEALNSEDETSSPLICSPVRKYLSNKSTLNSQSPSRQVDGFISDLNSDDKLTALIGSLPIAEYEGSPRRYGPRPGHPERIVFQEKNNCDDEDVLRLTTKPINHDVNVVRTDNPETAFQFDYLLRESQLEKGLKQIYECEVQSNVDTNVSNSYVGRRLAHLHTCYVEESPKRAGNGDVEGDCYQNVAVKNQFDDASSPYLADPSHKTINEVMDEDRETISTNPDTEDLGDTEMGEQVGQSRNFTLSPETTDCESNDVESEVSFENDESVHSDSHACGSMPVLEDGLSSGQASDADEVEMETETVTDGRRHHCADNPTALLIKKQISEIEKEISRRAHKKLPLPMECDELKELLNQECEQTSSTITTDITLDFLDPLRNETTSPCSMTNDCEESHNSKKDTVDEAIKEIKQAILKTKAMPLKTSSADKTTENDKPVWIPRHEDLKLIAKMIDDAGNKVHGKNEDGLEEECDTDQETDRLLGKQRTDDKGFFEDKVWCKQNSVVMSNCSAAEECESLNDSSDVEKNKSRKDKDHRKKGRSKEVLIHEPAVLIEGVLFRARYLGSTQLVCEGQPTKATRMMQAEEAVSRIKAPEGENQPSTEVDLFISTEKIMVLNTDLKEIMMDHSLRTISYIADIGDLVVLMARRRLMTCQEDQEPKIRRTPKMICHVFESEEAQFIAQSIGQAFQVAYMEFLKANGIEDHSFVKEMDYQEVLNSQEIYGDELEMFAKKEMQKEVIVPKARGEMLGVVIVESGWGSMLPTVVIANLSPSGAAARCGQLNIGDQIIAINGISLVGLPLSTCQNYIKNAKTQMVVKLTVVPCAPVVEVKIKRPDTKYQLGFSVQNGVICSLLRGGIAERGGVRVGHRIIEINGQSVVAVPHERIVNLLATSVGEILMKTMPTSMFRLLTGQETPVYI